MGGSPFLEEIACNLCASRRSSTLYERPYEIEKLSDAGAFAATTDEFQAYGRVVRCEDCGLAYTNPRPRQDLLLSGYADCVDDTYLSESSSRSINAHLSLNNIKRYVRSGRLLEVGSATGYFLNAARADFDVVGLELSGWACAIAREKFKLEVYNESMDTGRFAEGSLDCVVMIDVIEHLADPRGALERARRWLKPAGVLYLVTPDMGSFSAWLLRGSWWGLRPAHIYYFDRRTMARLLDDTGFDIVMQKSFGRIFSYGYWLSRLRHYPKAVTGAIGALVRWLDASDKLVYIDTRDSMEICARKRP